MERSRRLINLIGAGVTTVIAFGGVALLVVLPLSKALDANLQATEAVDTNRTARAQLDQLAALSSKLDEMRSELNGLRTEISVADEQRDASALVSAAARSSGARIISITFRDRQVFAAPTGGGIGADGKAPVQQPTADANAAQVQIPVTFEAEVSSTGQAAAFVDGLRGGPRLLQIVQADCSSTNDAKKYTVTVDALIFAAKG